MPGTSTPMNPVIKDSYDVDNCSSDPASSSGMLQEPSNTCALPPVPPPIPSCGLPPPPPLPMGPRSSFRPDSAPASSRTVTPRGPDDGSPAAQLPQQGATPLPKTQMKRLQWNKIPVARVASSPGNLWIEVAGMFKGYQLDFERMEQLFANAGNGTPSSSSVNGSAGTKGRELPVPEGSSLERKTKKMDEINLIDGKRSMNVNIFLRQFRMTNVDIVNCLRIGDSQKMGPERLRSLLKILPEPEDVQLLAAFEGDRTQLGSAEKFYLELIALPNHKFLAESLLMKEEFSQTIDYVKPAIDAIILSARDIKDSKALHEILYTVLMAGNFLNSGVYSGNAVGFQLQSLLKLSELRANKPHMNLLHFVAQEIETKNSQMIEKLKNLKYLAEASHYSIEALLSDISTLQNRVRTISSQISTADVHFQKKMKDFLEMALSEMEVLELDVRELEELRVELAVYLCEDQQTFKLDECISTFNSFCKMFHKAVEENRERHQQDLRAEERRRLREEQVADKRRSMTSNESQTRRSPDGHVAESSPEVSARSVDTVDFSRPRNTGPDRRIQISQTMPSFLLEPSTQESSREGSPCPGGGGGSGVATPPMRGHRKRNSMSNFLKLDGRKTLPQTPGENDRESELMEVLLKTASSAGDDSDRRPGSSGGSGRQRRRSRASIDLLDRERAASPSPLNASVPHMDTTGGGGSPPGSAAGSQLDRGQPARSSCPSRISSAQGRKQGLLKDALLHQQAAHDAVASASDTQMDDSGGSCQSDAELSAKQERENRRMERRLRSNTDTSSSRTSVTGDASDSKTPEVPTQAGKPPSNPTNGSDTTTTRPVELFYDDVKSRTTAAAIRRDAANIRSLGGDQRRWSSELGSPSQGSKPSNNDEICPNQSGEDSVAKGSSEYDINKAARGKTIRKSSGEQNSAIATDAARRAPHLSSLVKQNSIPEQRIIVGNRPNSGSQKNITKTEANEESPLTETAESRPEGSTKADQGRQYAASGLGAQGVDPNGPNVNGDHQKRWGKVFENEEKVTSDPDCSEMLQTRRANSPDDESKGTGEDAALEPSPQSASVRDYGELLYSSTAVERASSRKEKLRKLSQLYSPEDDDELGKMHASPNDRPPEDASTPRAAVPATDQFSRQTADPRPDADSFYSNRDEGFDSENHSLCSASQRTSMSSSAESEIRITPMMTRKTYNADPAAGETTGTGGDQADDAETTALLGRASIDSIVNKRIEKPAAVSPAAVDSTRKTSSALSRGSARTSSKSMFSSPKQSPAADQTGVKKVPTKAISIQQRPRTTPTHSAVKTVNKIQPAIIPSPRNVASSAAVQYRIAKPNMVAVSRAPPQGSDSRLGKKQPSSASPATTKTTPAASSSIGKSIRRQLPESKGAAPASRSTIGETVGRTQEKPSQPQAFVRGVGVRVTVPADVLRENKKAAVESRQVRNVAASVGPSPPTRKATSLLDANNTLAAAVGPQRSIAPVVLHPRKPSSSAAGLPAVELPAEKLDSTPTANAAKSGCGGTRKTSSEQRMPPASRTDRSKGPSRIPDPTSKRHSTDPHIIGDGRIPSSVTAVSHPGQRPDCGAPLMSVQSKVIHVAARPKTSSTVKDNVKAKTLPAAKTASVGSLS